MSFKNRTASTVLGLAAALAFSAPAWSADKVRLSTSMGDIVVELDAQKAPKSVANFEQYVKSGFYDGTIFHRVIDNFMIQGGGMTPDMKEKRTLSPIPLESHNGLKNVRGTLAMARTDVPDSATSQFFINVGNNAFLDPKPGNPGYTVFGRVVSGMDVVNAIKGVQTGRVGMHSDVPLAPVVINSAQIVK